MPQVSGQWVYVILTERRKEICVIIQWHDNLDGFILNLRIDLAQPSPL
jgi:hypothetical protein